MNLCFRQRLSLACRGRLSTLLIQKLTCSPYQLQHSKAVVSRRHFVDLNGSSDAACVFMQHGYTSSVNSAAFHPSAPYLATGSYDNTAKLWLLNSDCNAATCVSTLQGHDRGVTSVAFHASAPYLATGSEDNTAKIWR